MKDKSISRRIALRIALAARILSDIDPAGILDVLDKTIGLPPTEQSLNRLKFAKLKRIIEEKLSIEVEPDTVRQIIACLKGEQDHLIEHRPPEPVSYNEGDMPGSLRIACASDHAEELDGHFSSCSRFLIYQVSEDEIRLIDVRHARLVCEKLARDERNSFRASLVDDCQVLFVVSIGGPAMAKVVNSGVHPIKEVFGGNARERLVSLQKVIASGPPPWLANAMQRKYINHEKNVELESISR